MEVGKIIPPWALSKISAVDLDRIEEAIQNFDQEVAGEVLPIFVRSSTAVAFARGYFFCLFCAVFLFCQAFFLWGWAALVGGIIGCAALSFFVSKSLFFCHFLVPHRDQDFEVHEAAELDFYRFHVNQTSEHGGILIYLSWIERRAVILADPVLDAKVDSTLWKRAMVLMQLELREGRVGEAFVKVIDFCRVQLKEHFPRPDVVDGSDHPRKNQLSNRLIIR